MLLSQPDCALCAQAQELLAGLQAEYPLEVQTIDFYSSQGFELAKRGRLLSPPGVFLDGQPFSYGRLSERKLREALEARLRDPAGGSGTAIQG